MLLNLKLWDGTQPSDQRTRCCSSRSAAPTITPTPNSLPDFTDPTKPFVGKDQCTYEIVWDPHYNNLINCYGFVLGLRPIPPGPILYYPGFLSGISNSEVPTTAYGLLNAVKNDLKLLGRKVMEVHMADEGQLPQTLQYHHPDGSYWIKLMLENGDSSNWHFAMLDPNSGRWIHKMGYADPPMVLYHQGDFKTLKSIFLSQFSSGVYVEELADQFLGQSANFLRPQSYYLETDDSAGFSSVYQDFKLLRFDPVWVIRVSN